MKPKLTRRDFFTRTPANTATPMPLTDPVSGQDSGEFLMVLGIDSDAFREALNKKQQENARILSLPEADQPAAKEKADLELFAALVTGWSFEEPATMEDVVELLRESPSTKRALDRWASDNSNFIKRPSQS